MILYFGYQVFVFFYTVNVCDGYTNGNGGAWTKAQCEKYRPDDNFTWDDE